MKAKLTGLKTNLVGKSTPETKNGHAGRYVEQELIKQGFELDTHGIIDIPKLDVEVKTRDVDATSAQTVGSMTPEDIKHTPYRQSNIFKKFQKQFRVHIKDNVIVDAKLVDFEWNEIQNRVESSYEAARQRIVNGETKDYVPGGKYGYFERTVAGSESYDFRIRDKYMKQLESMSRSTAKNLFTFE